MEPGLVERERELAVLRSAVDRARQGDGALIVIRGPAGIGKSSLLDALLREPGDGVSSMRARCASLEVDLPYGVVHQLLDAVVRGCGPAERDRMFRDAAAPARGLFEGLTVDADAATLARALFWLVAALAEDGPLVIAVDDLQWADRSSLHALAHLAHRVADLPVALLLALRDTATTDAVAALADHPAAEVLEPRPIGREGTAALTRELLGAEPEDEFIQASGEATGGNPFLLRELLRETARSGTAPDAAGAQAVSDLRPAHVARHVRGRLRDLDTAAQRLAGAASLLGDETPLRLVARLAGLDLAVAVVAADALVAQAVLAHPDPVRFAHALVRDIVAEETPRAQRAQRHYEAARLLADDGAAPERVVAQLHLGPRAGDEWTVARLREAAEGAVRGGDPAAAARHLLRALQEPPAPEHRASVLRALGHAEQAAGDPGAGDRFAAAAEHAVDPERRLADLLDGAMALHWAGRCHTALEQLAAIEPLVEQADDPRLRRRVALDRLDMACLYDAGLVDALIDEVLHDLPAEPSGEDDARALLYAAHAAVARGRPAAEALALAERALSAAPDRRAAIEGCAAIRVEAGQPAEAAVLFEHLQARARRVGDARDEILSSLLRVWPLIRAGRITEAAGEAVLIEERRRLGWDDELFIRGDLAWALTEHDEPAEAVRLLDGRTFPLDGHAGHAWQVEQRARALLALGRPVEALAALRDARPRFDSLPLAMGHIATSQWRTLTAEAGRAAGDLRADEQQAVEIAFLQASAWEAPAVLGHVLRVKGQLTSGEEQIALLERAESLLSETSARLELTEARLALGAALRRDGSRSRAREPLRLGLADAERCGMRRLARLIADELRATGARPRRTELRGIGALTPSEHRVCELAAAGATNRQIAQTLFVTTKAVEWHLRNAYPKLGVKGKGELTAVFSDAAPSTSDPG